jgi:ATP adenylyltransferase
MPNRPLWAPWRIEYIRGPKPDECIFCAAAGAASGDDAAHGVVHRGERCLVVVNAYPYGSGHLMVAPHRHVGSLEELDAGELAEVSALTNRALRALRAVMAPDGFNLGVNVGEVAGAGFADHVHQHVVPRWQGDTNFMPVIADTRVMPQALEATRAEVAAAFDR